MWPVLRGFKAADPRTPSEKYKGWADLYVKYYKIPRKKDASTKIKILMTTRKKKYIYQKNKF